MIMKRLTLYVLFVRCSGIVSGLTDKAEMKRNWAFVLSLFVAASLTVLFSGCAGTRIRKLSGEEFQRLAGQTDILGSFAQYSYIGNTHDRAYLEYQHPAFIGKGVQLTVYWTFTKELPSNIVEQIHKGEKPWTNAIDKIIQQGGVPNVNTRR